MQINNRLVMNRIMLSLMLAVLLAAGIHQADAQPERRHIREGNRLYNKEMFDESELSYRRALESDEESSRARFNLGNSLYKQGRYDEAARYFGELGEDIDDPLNRSKVFHNLGNSMLMMQQVEQSIEAYKEALRNNPHDHETRYNLAFAQSLLDEQQNMQQEGDDDRQEGEDDGEDQDGGSDRQEHGDEEDGQEPETGEDDRPDSGEDQPQPRPDQISPEDAMRMLEAAEREEQRVQEKLMEQKETLQRPRSGRNW